MIATDIEHRRDGPVGPFIEGHPLHVNFVQVGRVAIDQVTDIHDEFGPQQIQLSDGRRKDAGPLAAREVREHGEGELAIRRIKVSTGPWLNRAAYVVVEWCRITFDRRCCTGGKNQ